MLFLSAFLSRTAISPIFFSIPGLLIPGFIFSHGARVQTSLQINGLRIDCRIPISSPGDKTANVVPFAVLISLSVAERVEVPTFEANVAEFGDWCRRLLLNAAY